MRYICLLMMTAVLACVEYRGVDYNGVIDGINAVLQRPEIQGALSARGDGWMHFEKNKRTFIVYRQLKTGAWQPPSEEVGPDMDGIRVAIHETVGSYTGSGDVDANVTGLNLYVWDEYTVIKTNLTNSKHITLHFQIPNKRKYEDVVDPLIALAMSYQ